MNNIEPPFLSPENFDRFREAFDEMARPFFAQIMHIKLIAGRRCVIKPDGALGEEQFLFTPEQVKALAAARQMVDLCREIAMKEALRRQNGEL